MNKKNYLIVIVGPTAIGKTALSLSLARGLGTEIISADSRQFYKELQIGTAAPTREELAAAPHHLVHHLSVQQDYSVGSFEHDAITKITELHQQHKLVVMVGGSGLYIDAVTKGLDYFPQVDPSVRRDLNEHFEKNGIQWLQKTLQSADPEYYSKVDLQNPHRLIRALEISLGTGKPYSSFRKKTPAERPFETLFIGLTADRELLYERIEKRVDAMMDEGLLEEVQRNYKDRHRNALNTVGYKELFTYLDQEISLEEAITAIKRNTRRFAKRQLTWFRRNQEINWFDMGTPPEEILRFVRENIKE